MFSPKLSARAALLATLCFSAAAHAAPIVTHAFGTLALSSDGSHLASVEHDSIAGDDKEPTLHLLIRAGQGHGAPVSVSLPNGTVSSPTWRPDGAALAFVLHDPKQHQRFVYSVDAAGRHLTKLLAFDGTLQNLRYGPDGKLAVLAIAGARREPGALQAGTAQTGEIGAHEDEQRIATIENGHLVWQSPADLYVYEYDWRPGATPGFVGTAAHGNGDDHWWIAHLYAFSGGQAHDLYAPPPQQQIGVPRVAPDGQSVAFIGGLMSDFGFFGGDAYQMSLTDPQAKPVNLTPGIKATVTNLSYGCADGLTASGIAGAQTAFWSLGNGAPRALWTGDDLLTANSYREPALLCAKGQTVAIRQNFTKAPELWSGPIGQWSALTHANAALKPQVHAQNVTWTNDGFSVQGWLLTPVSSDGATKRPMITEIHGGPSSSNEQAYVAASGEVTRLVNAGYDVFEPNPRGSYGQGEAFTAANRRDFGHGDLRDVLTGIDAAEKLAPIDDAHLGVTGYSYGGYMTMWTVTQTDRFKAAVAGGGISNWQSYYGENGIDSWLIPFFGASVYDDPDIYAKSSPITFIKHTHTPTFVYVGANDEECPPPQSEEFYHALRTLGVPTSLVIYAGEGHGMHKQADWHDAMNRTIAWFDTYLKPKKG
ncbi:S9 family peptidase [Tanticharoenia sakaeratensis]|uniref:Peptidase, S9C (Acylaminoacyl-peptidase) family n=1 Tax=Tanticharoenia sakaeratensis NBRC 103193 TaxID=1231623 RepID=A0A0D6MIK3_9PROT|nr:prolyl oligopeptidase family serine peptidase [Tanticharoenia sakaeratensis]GAN53113.1 peptidase, S9C (acylaminoacyl-peptidase) family [Tanticharoenia sakaeratensis NBRC 103193]GBQ20536.1 putative peptidase [Tanticharoenia sakaeratensis NBRC 103193]